MCKSNLTRHFYYKHRPSKEKNEKELISKKFKFELIERRRAVEKELFLEYVNLKSLFLNRKQRDKERPLNPYEEFKGKLSMPNIFLNFPVRKVTIDLYSILHEIFLLRSSDPLRSVAEITFNRKISNNSFLFTDGLLLKLLVLTLLEIGSHQFQEEPLSIQGRVETGANSFKLIFEDNGFFLPLSLREDIYHLIYPEGVFPIFKNVKMSIPILKELIKKLGFQLEVEKSSFRRGAVWSLEIPYTY